MNGAPTTTTPEFIRWAIARRCLLRDSADWESPEQAERQLRSLQVYCDAVADGRFFEGICVAAAGAPGQPPTKGFRANEVLDAYGGEEFVHQQCDSCPANVQRALRRKSLAGCFGMLEFSAIGEHWHELVERAIQATNAAVDFNAAFMTTCPRWYGLWATSPLDTVQLELHRLLAQSLANINAQAGRLLNVWCEALAAAKTQGLPLHVQLCPPGEIANFRWIVAAHCPRCRAPRSLRQRVCPICGTNDHALPERRRHIRGARPYWPLRGFMDEETLLRFLQRYQQHSLGE